MSDFNVINLNLREKDCSSIQEDKFLEYLITLKKCDFEPKTKKNKRFRSCISKK